MVEPFLYGKQNREMTMAFNRMCIFHRETAKAIIFNNMLELQLEI